MKLIMTSTRARKILADHGPALPLPWQNGPFREPDPLSNAVFAVILELGIKKSA
jgi:hypothetical protein